jgi:deoxyribose-phosphate aldolase
MISDIKVMAATIDHTLLKPQATSREIGRLCQEAVDYGFFAICINPCFVFAASERLVGSPIKICSVIGFPLGANCPASKAHEAELASRMGAGEIDMVMAIGAAKDGNWELVSCDIAGVVGAVPPGVVVKVILETCYLTPSEIISACQAVRQGGAHFVKTSTGFGPQGATREVLELMKRTVGDTLKIKAAGGIRDLYTAQTMLLAGADRLGTSAGTTIIDELRSNPPHSG